MLTKEGTLKHITVDGVKIQYHDSGSGFPLLMLHGGGPGASGWSNYSRNVDAFSEHSRVIIPDIPGFGGSDKVLPSGEVLGFLSNVMSSFLSALGIAKADVVGNSLGGGTALKLTIDYPEMVGKLILMGPGGVTPPFTVMPTEGIRKLFEFYMGDGPSRQKLKDFLDLFVYDKSEITDELFEQRYAAATLPEVVANPPLKWMGRPPLEDLLKDDLDKIESKVLLIYGRDDRVVPLDSAFMLLKIVRQASLHVFPECGHWAQWEKHNEFNALVSNFITS